MKAAPWVRPLEQTTVGTVDSLAHIKTSDEDDETDEDEEVEDAESGGFMSSRVFASIVSLLSVFSCFSIDFCDREGANSRHGAPREILP